jgi:hypothetical protein
MFTISSPFFLSFFFFLAGSPLEFCEKEKRANLRCKLISVSFSRTPLSDPAQTRSSFIASSSGFHLSTQPAVIQALHYSADICATSGTSYAWLQQGRGIREESSEWKRVCRTKCDLMTLCTLSWGRSAGQGSRSTLLLSSTANMFLFCSHAQVLLLLVS